MGFDAKITFTGLCAYVPNAELNNKYIRPSKMFILTPNAGTRSTLGQALDGRELRKHYPVLKFSARNLEEQGSMPDDAEVMWHLEGMEVKFEIVEEKPDSNDFEVYQDLSTPNQIERDDKDFNWGAPMNEIAPDYADINTDLFGEFDGQDENRLISSRIVIEQGLLSTNGLNRRIDWRFDRVLDGTFEDRPLSNEVALEFNSITRLTVYARPFGGEEQQSLVLVGRDDEALLLEIGNLCEQCLFTPYADDTSEDGDDASENDDTLDDDILGSGLDRILRDEDFCWYYEFAYGASGIRQILVDEDRASLPIPVPVRLNQGTGSRLVECMRVTYNAYDPEKAESSKGEEEKNV